MIQYFAPDIATTLQLPDDEAHHCIKVLRSRPGDEIEVIDGKGTRYRCRLTGDSTRRATVDIISTTPIPPSWSTEITVAVAPTKNMERMEWLVEKLTEIGVNSIVPLLCRHSERKELKIERLQRIAVSAMKQSLKARLPEIMPMTSLKKWVSTDHSEQRFMAYCDPSIPRRLLAKEYNPHAKSVSILIGPEGDFDSDEIKHTLAGGYQPVTLGNNRLRTETAALVACDTFHIINQFSSVNE